MYIHIKYEHEHEHEHDKTELSQLDYDYETYYNQDSQDNKINNLRAHRLQLHIALFLFILTSPDHERYRVLQHIR